MTVKSAKTDLWYPFFVGDYRRDTARLSCEQHGAYRQLIDEYWITGPLPDDDEILARIVGLELRTWRKHRTAIARFFRVDGGVWSHGRIDHELSQAATRKAKATEKATTAAEARWGKTPKHTGSDASSMPQALPEDMHKECPSPSPTPDGVKKDADASSVGSGKPMPTAGKIKSDPWLRDGAFVEAWSSCTDQMRARSSRRQAWTPWRANSAASADKAAALNAYLQRDPDVKRTGGPGFHLWLRDRLDEWLTAPPEGVQVVATWQGPADVREAIETGLGGAARAATFLRTCRWDEDRRAISTTNGFVAIQIRDNAGPRLSRLGVRVLQEGIGRHEGD